MKSSAYLAPENLVKQVTDSLKNVLEVRERLVIAKGDVQPCPWAQNVWYEPETIKFDSIKDAAKKLRSIQRNWVLYSTANHRRAKLIAAELPHVSAKPLRFPAALPTAPLGSWTLLDANTLLAAKHCSSSFPNGEVFFEENHSDPPSRAYLKLWELFTLIQKMPGRGDRCLELGGSPGGWTWVLQKLGVSVTTVDRAPLEHGLEKKPGVKFVKGDAFRIGFDEAATYNWIFSDLACYPEKLFTWLSPLLDAGRPINFVCTLKFQGSAHYPAIKKFAAVPGSRLLHLFHNKHELSWVRAM